MPPRKKRREPEYRLRLSHGLGEETRQPVIVAEVETVQVFVNFNYQILLDASVEENRVLFNIRGLHAPPLLLPAMGPARGRIELPPLQGRYLFIIRKLRRDENEFEIEFLPDRIQVLRSPKQPFITITTD